MLGIRTSPSVVGLAANDQYLSLVQCAAVALDCVLAILYLNKSSLVIVLCLVLYTCYSVSIAMEWTDEKVLVLIEEYKSRPGLWEPNHPHYKYANRKNEYWRSLANAVQTNVAEVKKKLNSLLASFRRERAKVKKTSGKSSKEVFKSNWFAYNSMAFLLHKFKFQPTPRSSEV